MFKGKGIVISGDTYSNIGNNTLIKGDIITQNDIRIDGKVEGNITVKGKVVLGSSAHVIGDIRCEEADLMGKIEGNVQATGVLSLRSTVVLIGSVIVKNLEIEPGAVFNGACRMQ
ncbi:polymer-forming cytoskeletal protein [Bacteroidales bacterium OttesenSCG-928-I14]|nr:polymer-forming cytoskeletal protein [Bacteroidales bacterium OttesenSCG-928-I14]